MASRSILFGTSLLAGCVAIGVGCGQSLNRFVSPDTKLRGLGTIYAVANGYGGIEVVKIDFAGNVTFALALNY